MQKARPVDEVVPASPSAETGVGGQQIQQQQREAETRAAPTLVARSAVHPCPNTTFPETREPRAQAAPLFAVFFSCVGPCPASVVA